VTLALYLDDCAFSHDLRRLLLAAGHSVVVPADAGLTQVSDDRHFAYAVGHQLIVVTKDPADFQLLHEQTLLAGAHHPGIFAVYQDNDPSRDMSNGDIVNAIANAEAWYGGQAGGLTDLFLSLNACRS
jgi:predicted nuclease of predicted toxin-antitoxin system